MKRLKIDSAIALFLTLKLVHCFCKKKAPLVIGCVCTKALAVRIAARASNLTTQTCAARIYSAKWQALLLQAVLFNLHPRITVSVCRYTLTWFQL